LSNISKSLSAINNVKAVTSGDLLAKYNNTNNSNRKRAFNEYIKPGHTELELNSEVLLNSNSQLTSENL
jgi:hypothetical protein